VLHLVRPTLFFTAGLIVLSLIAGLLSGVVDDYRLNLRLLRAGGEWVFQKDANYSNKKGMRFSVHPF
jgi:hypothetical protein